MRKFTDIKESKEEFNQKELEMGIDIESEHGDIYRELKSLNIDIPWTERQFYEKIAKSHLREIPDYYTRLREMENK